MADIPYLGLCLYSADGQVILTDDAAHEADLRAAGWQETPAAFGLETHPARTTSRVAFPTMVPGVPTAPQASAATTLLERQVQALQAMSQQQDREMTLFQREMLAVVERLDRLEADLFEPDTSAAPTAPQEKKAPPPTKNPSPTAGERK